MNLINSRNLLELWLCLSLTRLVFKIFRRMFLRFIYICFVTFYTYFAWLCALTASITWVSPGWPDLLRRALRVLLRGGGPQAQEGGAGRPHPPRQRQRQPPRPEVLPQPVDNHLMRHFVISSQIVCKYVHVQQVVLQFTMYYSKCFFVSNLSVISKVVSNLQNVKYQFNGSSIFY